MILNRRRCGRHWTLFEKQNPDIKVTLQRVSWGEAQQQYLREAAAGTGPDVAEAAQVSGPDVVRVTRVRFGHLTILISQNRSAFAAQQLHGSRYNKLSRARQV